MGSGDSAPEPQYLILARVLRPHGVRGDLSVQILTDFPERMTSLNTVYFAADPADLRRLSEQRVTWARRHKNDTWLLHLNAIETRDDADNFRGQVMMVSLADAVPLEEDEVYLFQVIGLEVHTLEGDNLGRIVDIIETGANDVYVVQGGPHGEILLPAIESVIRYIDVDAGVMTVQIPEGLLPDTG